MSLSDSMRDVGRPVAYYPRLARFFGSVNAAIFYAQLFYWHDKTDNPMGVFKTSQEWEEETGLTYREQATARRAMVHHGYLVEHHKRLEHKVFYLLNVPAVDDAFSRWTKAHPAEQQKRIPPNDENAFREVRSTHSVNSTESTSETTSQSTSQASPMDGGFDLFWTAGMVKTGRKKALALFAGIVKRTKADPAELGARLAADVAERIRVQQFGFDKLHPSTYLTQERWTDEVRTAVALAPNSGFNKSKQQQLEDRNAQAVADYWAGRE